MDKRQKNRAVIFAAITAIAAVVLMLSELPPSQQDTTRVVAKKTDTVTAKTALSMSFSTGEKIASTLPAISQEVAEEIRRLSKPTTEGLTTEELPNGAGTYMDMQDRHKQILAAAIDENGNVVIAHGEDFLNNIKEEQP